jgi:DNA primase
VASLGTALTAAQLGLARRFAPEVVAFFDGDRAGQTAAVRAFPVCIEAGVWGLGAFLPEGHDPDSYVREHGAAATTSLLERAVPLADFFIQRHDPGPDATLPQRARAAAKIGEVITQIRDPFQFDLLAKKAAQQLAVDEAVFRSLRPSPGSKAAAGAEAESPGSAEAFRPEETTLLEAMALDREVAALVAQRGVLERFSSATLADAGRAVLAVWQQEQNAASAVDRLPSAVAQRVTAAWLGEGALAAGNRLQAARECIMRVERRARRAQTREGLTNLRQAEAAGDDARSREELRRQNALLRRNVADG